MIDEKQRPKGKYTDEYSEIIYGVKVHIKETTVVGRNFEVMNFAREYDPAIPYVATEGIHVNKYTTNVKGVDTNITETTVVNENGKVTSFKRESDS